MDYRSCLVIYQSHLYTDMCKILKHNLNKSELKVKSFLSDLIFSKTLFYTDKLAFNYTLQSNHGGEG